MKGVPGVRAIENDEGHDMMLAEFDKNERYPVAAVSQSLKPTYDEPTAGEEQSFGLGFHYNRLHQ